MSKPIETSPHQSHQFLINFCPPLFHRFVIMGFGSESRVTIRTFRGDEPEIEKFVENWRTLIETYLLSKSDELGSRNLPVGLSKIGAYVTRPIGGSYQLFFCHFVLMLFFVFWSFVFRFFVFYFILFFFGLMFYVVRILHCLLPYVKPSILFLSSSCHDHESSLVLLSPFFYF